MLKDDSVLCDVRDCSQRAIGGVELRIDASHSGKYITIAGDLIAWCELHEENLREGIDTEFRELTLEQLKKMYTAGLKNSR